MSKLMLVAVLFASFACKKKEDTGTAQPAAKTAATAPAGSAAPAAAPSGDPAAAAVPASPAAAAPVDCCAMMPKDKVEAIAGKLVSDPTPSPANGSMLGMCMAVAEKGTSVVVSARPANEFDGTLAANKGTDVAGVGEKASLSDTGMLVKLAGKPYFLQVMALDINTKKPDPAMTTALAKLAIENAK